jgi:hypothetical protein
MPPKQLTCPNCDALVTPDQRWCRNCGGHLADLDLPTFPTTGRRRRVILVALALLLAASGAGVTWWMLGRGPDSSDIASILPGGSPADDMAVRTPATMWPRTDIDPASATATYLPPTITPTAGIQDLTVANPAGHTPTAMPFLPLEGTAAAADVMPAATYVPETFYASPIFGYSFGWDSSWMPSWSGSGPGFDQMVITNGTSSLAFTGTDAYGGDPERCLEGVAGGMAASPDIVQVDRAEGAADGSRITMGNASISATYVYTVQLDGRIEQKRIAYVECIVLVPNQADLAIVHSLPENEAEREVPAMRAVLTTLRMPR